MLKRFERTTSGFSLIELTIVIVVMAIVVAIALPRFGATSDRAQDSAAFASLVVLEKAIDLYAAEHGNQSAAMKGGSIIATDDFIARLTERTNYDGEVDPDGTFGPYLKEIPRNSRSGLSTLRIDGPDPGVGAAGWHYSSLYNQFTPDDPHGAAVVIESRKVKGIPTFPVAPASATPFETQQSSFSSGTGDEDAIAAPTAPAKPQGQLTPEEEEKLILGMTVTDGALRLMESVRLRPTTAGEALWLMTPAQRNKLFKALSAKDLADIKPFLAGAAIPYP